MSSKSAHFKKKDKKEIVKIYLKLKKKFVA